MYYFAYGSNMDKDDLDSWCKDKKYPLVNFLSISPAILHGYKLAFNYLSTSRNGGAANIMESKEDCCYGLLAELKNSDLESIRKKENCPNNYDEICVDVEHDNGEVISGVKTYKVIKQKETADHQPPTKYYIGLIIKNAKKYNFPDEYIKFLESFIIKED